MKFTKMQGIGNDFVIIDKMPGYDGDYGKLALKVCDRHFGIGADGLMIVEDSKAADSRMLIFNSDGSLAEMCGNGIRCFAKYLYDNGIVKKESMVIETLDGLKEITLEVENGYTRNIRVDMGKPVFAPDSVPVLLKGDSIINEEIIVGGEKYKITSMLMGVPHTVIFVDDVMNYDVVSAGRKIECSKLFPKKTNVNFVQVISSDEFRVRTWERGAGLTLACGTGTCASLIACVLNNKTGKKALAHLPGGDLYIEWSEEGNAYMTGPAETVFTGEYILK